MKFVISKEVIQSFALGSLERELSLKEYEDVFERIEMNVSDFIVEKIYEVVEFDEMIESNKDAEKVTPHYEVYYRNENACQREFKRLAVFKNQQDSQRFIRHDFMQPQDEWRVMLINKNQPPKEVYRVKH